MKKQQRAFWLNRNRKKREGVDMWGAFIGVFVGIWLLQLALTWVQMKHYQNTIRAMSNRSSGFLGTGVKKSKLGIGNVVIIVCDQQGVVQDSQIMSGVTVFVRFKKFDQIIGYPIDRINDLDIISDVENPIQMAVNNIKEQMEKCI